MFQTWKNTDVQDVYKRQAWYDGDGNGSYDGGGNDGWYDGGGNDGWYDGDGNDGWYDGDGSGGYDYYNDPYDYFRDYYDVQEPVSYTHLDVYKRQVRIKQL